MGCAHSAAASFVLYKNQSSSARFTTSDLGVNFCCLVAEKTWEMNRIGILAAVWLFFIVVVVVFFFYYYCFFFKYPVWITGFT
jgi:hypothetical protein